MLNDILAITGKSGLYKLISRGKGMLVIQSLEDGRRMPTHARDKVVSLADISMFTQAADVPLGEVLQSLFILQEGKVVDFDPKKADNDTLRTFFANVLPDFDRDRVYPSDIRKLIQWYNLLVKSGVTEFVEPADAETTDESAGAAAKAETVPTMADTQKKKPAPKRQVKTQKSAAVSVKTGVGTKRG